MWHAVIGNTVHFMHVFLHRKEDPICYGTENNIENLYNKVLIKVVPLKIQVTGFSVKFGPDLWLNQLQ